MSRRRLVTLVSLGAVLVLAGFVGVVLATSGSSSDRLVIYTARSHYGEEQPFKDFAARTDTKLTLFGGEASELYERIQSEGEDTRADMLITVDAANLWRATEAGLLEKVDDPELERNVPANLRDPQGRWFGLTVRARTIMRSTERVGPNDVTTYAGLGDPRWKGKLCLRSGTSDYNVSFVADRIAKDGRAEDEGDARALDGERPGDPRLGHRRARRDRGRRLRRGPDELVLPGPRARRTTPTSRWPWSGPTRTAAARTSTSRASAWSRAPTSARRTSS